MSRSKLPPGIPEGTDPRTIVDDGVHPPYVASGRPYVPPARPAAPAAASRLPEGSRLTDSDQVISDADYAKFRAAQAAQAKLDEAMAGNGSDNGLVRWLTRKPLPVTMTGYRIACGLCWAFWTVVFTIGLVAVPGAGTKLLCLLLAALCGLYDWRIWTKRASRLSWLIIF
jgi:hypothetical protein